MKFAKRLPPSLEPVLLAALLFGAYLAFDIGLRDSAKAAIVFLLGAQVLSRLPGNPRLRQAAEVVWRFGFVLDFLCRAFLMSVYRTHPDAALVLDAVGNTSTGETLEFIRHHRVDIGIHLAAAVGITVASLVMMCSRRPSGVQLKGLTLGLSLLVGSHMNPTVRAANPFLYWPSQGLEYGQYQDDMDSLAAKRGATIAKLDALEVRYAGPASNTVAVVMGESIHRGNWSLYSYPRPTSPTLDARAEDMIVFRNVRAADSNTVGAFRHMMTAQDHTNGLKAEDEPSVVLLAKRAGYKTFWISNQHDRYINTRFAQEADVVALLNQGGRRSDSSLDERLMPAWNEALQDPAPKKFIVVHMLGAHPHYEQRRPPHLKPFTGLSDTVSEQMRQAGRMPWIVSLRNEYDNALRYHDRVVSSLLDRFKATNQDRPGFFLYTSDHGQDVGIRGTTLVTRRAGRASKYRCSCGLRLRAMSLRSESRRRVPTKTTCSTGPCSTCSTSACAMTSRGILSSA